MPNFFKDLYLRTENLKGRSLVLVLLLVIIFPLILGIVVQNISSRILNNNENGEQTEIIEEVPIVESVRLEGKVNYLDPKLFPHDDISYSLVDSNGDRIMLLTALDKKLTVVEGLDVIVFGQKEKTANGEEDVLNVEKIVVRNR